MFVDVHVSDQSERQTKELTAFAKVTLLAQTVRQMMIFKIREKERWRERAIFLPAEVMSQEILPDLPCGCSS